MDRKVYTKVFYLLLLLIVSGISLSVVHEGQQSPIMTVFQQAIDVTPGLFEMKMECKGRSFRQNIVQIQNLFSQKDTYLNLQEIYLGSGDKQLNWNGFQLSEIKKQIDMSKIQNNKTKIVRFVSRKGIPSKFASSTGIQICQIHDGKGYGLVIYFSNPIGWNSLGVCVRNISNLQSRSRSNEKNKIKQIFNKLSARKKWNDDECIFFDNRQKKQIPFFRRGSFRIHGYKIYLLVKYVKEYNTIGDCFYQTLVIGIGEATKSGATNSNINTSRNTDTSEKMYSSAKSNKSDKSSKSSKRSKSGKSGNSK